MPNDAFIIKNVVSSIKDSRLTKFLLVGVLNTAFGYGVFALAILMGCAPQVALLIQFCIGCIWNYFTHARLVFEHNGYRQMPLYILTYVGIYCLNAIILSLIIGAGIAPLIAQAILTPFMAVLSYFLISQVLRPSKKL